MTQIGNVYGEALYSLAREEGLSDAVLQELKLLRDAFTQEPDYVLNFLKILTEKGYARYFCDCCDAYREIYNSDHGILTVKAVTAVALTDQQAAKLSNKLAAITGKTIELQNRVDPGCLGGVRLDYDGKRVDGTVASRLDAVRSLLKNTVL